ncbi:MAG: hypothetical protein PUB32_02220 [Clostridiales bacterium]|nr:hypothetical protein [Clostridiales bacterium]
MEIIRKTAERSSGPYEYPLSSVSCSLCGTVLSFREGELSIDIDKYRRSFPVHLEVGENEFGMLILGTARRLAAEIDIPPIELEYTFGEADDIGFPKMYKAAKPLDTDKLRVTIWEREDFYVF